MARVLEFLFAGLLASLVVILAVRLSALEMRVDEHFVVLSENDSHFEEQEVVLEEEVNATVEESNATLGEEVEEEKMIDVVPKAEESDEEEEAPTSV